MMTRPKMEDYAFPKSENDYEQLGFYTDYLEDYCDVLEKALLNACSYIDDNGINGCPFNYDFETILDKKINECSKCQYECIGYKEGLEDKGYRKKSIKCWKEYFLRGDTEND